MKRFLRAYQPKRKQCGAVLIVGLVMVLLLSIIALASIRGSGLQESMAGNMHDREIGFQAAESALRVAETIISPPNINLPVFEGEDGLHRDLYSNKNLLVESLTAEKWKELAQKTELNFQSVSDEPLYLIEEMNALKGACAAEEGSAHDLESQPVTGSCIPYRVSGRATGGNTDTIVILQTTYRRRFP